MDSRVDVAKAAYGTGFAGGFTVALAIVLVLVLLKSYFAGKQ